jgi:hypothetical protein
VAKHTKPHQHLAAISLYVCILLYPTYPAYWNPKILLEETVSLLSSEDPKIQVLCLEALLEIQGRNLVRSFVESNGLARLAQLLRSTHYKVLPFACFASSKLLNENLDIFSGFVSSGCFDLVLNVMKSTDPLNIHAALTVIRCLLEFKNTMITLMLDSIKVYDPLICVLQLGDYKVESLEITILTDVLESLESILVFSQNIDAGFGVTLATLKELGLHTILAKLTRSRIPAIASQASKLKNRLFE